jgi:hypothetical protein
VRGEVQSAKPKVFYFVALKFARLPEHHILTMANEVIFIFILGLERMKGLRDGAVKWSLACSYDQQRYKTNDVLVVFMHQLDPLGSSDGRKCPKVQRIGVNGQACRNCIVGMTSGF